MAIRLEELNASSAATMPGVTLGCPSTGKTSRPWPLPGNLTGEEAEVRVGSRVEMFAANGADLSGTVLEVTHDPETFFLIKPDDGSQARWFDPRDICVGA